jgi:hypothetical protein
MDRREISSRGGRARAAKLSADRRRDIARMGWLALVERRFAGDAQAAREWLRAKGLWANDQSLPPEIRRFRDPGPMPQGDHT